MHNSVGRTVKKVANKTVIDNSIKQIIHNKSLKRKVEDYHDKIKPIAVALDKMQRDETLISEAVEIWNELEKSLNLITLKEKDKKSLNQRKEMAITPGHLLANLLDPRYCGKNLTIRENSSAMAFFNELDPNFFTNCYEISSKIIPL